MSPHFGTSIINLSWCSDLSSTAEATQIISLVFIRLVTSAIAFLKTTAPVSSIQFEFAVKFPVALPSVQFQTFQSVRTLRFTDLDFVGLILDTLSYWPLVGYQHSGGAPLWSVLMFWAMCLTALATTADKFLSSL